MYKMCVFLLICHQILRLIIQKQNASLHSRWSQMKSFGTSQSGERESKKNQTPPSPIILFSFENTCCRGYGYAKCSTIKGFPSFLYFTLINRSVWKNKSSCKNIQYTGIVSRRLMEQRSILQWIIRYFNQCCSYRPREMSSKKPVSRLRQVIPVQKRVSDIV